MCEQFGEQIGTSAVPATVKPVSGDRQGERECADEQTDGDDYNKNLQEDHYRSDRLSRTAISEGLNGFIT